MEINSCRLVFVSVRKTVSTVAENISVAVLIFLGGEDLVDGVLAELDNSVLVNDHEVDVLAQSVLDIAACLFVLGSAVVKVNSCVES